MVTSLGPQCDIVTQSYPLHLTIETPWGPVRFTMPFIVLPGGVDVVIIGPKTLREKLGIDVTAQLKASALKAHGREDGAEMETTAGAVGEPNAGAVLRAAMAVTAFGPGGEHLGVFRRTLLGDPLARMEYDRAASARCKGCVREAACFSYHAHPWR